MSFGLKQQKDTNVDSEVIASANLTDNALVKGNGGAKGIQTTTILVDDSENITGVNSIVSSSLATDAIETLAYAGVTYTPKIFGTKSSATQVNLSLGHFSNNNTQADEPILVLGRGRGTKASKLAVQDNDYLGEIIFAGYNGTDWSLGARILSQVNGAIGDGDMPTSILIQTSADGSETPTTKMEIDNSGYITFPNNSLKLTQRPDLDYRNISALGKPTAIIYGSWNGFSLPIFNSDDEELFFSIKTPERWDGTTNPIVKMHIWLGGAEDVGDKFKLQLSVSSSNCDDVLSGTPTDIPVETTILTDKASQYQVYCIDFEIDATNISAGDILSGRLRRIASSSSEIDNEVVVFDWNAEFKRDKLGGIWS